MYGWMFRQLPGPLWVRISASMLLIAAAVALLFDIVFPWIFSLAALSDPTIGTAPVQGGTTWR
ncbi:hypothetical protein D6T65_15300 [Arthrobacter frigidicola]|nr:hypothetical protein D6T65_15300 [Arthrobacter frigidicola]